MEESLSNAFSAVIKELQVPCRVHVVECGEVIVCGDGRHFACSLCGWPISKEAGHTSTANLRFGPS